MYIYIVNYLIPIRVCTNHEPTELISSHITKSLAESGELLGRYNEIICFIVFKFPIVQVSFFALQTLYHWKIALSSLINDKIHQYVLPRVM